MAVWSPPPSPRDDPRRTPSPRASSSRSRSAPRRQRSLQRRRASPATETARTERPGGAARTQEMALSHPCRLLFKLFHYYFECGQLRARQGRARARKPIPVSRNSSPQSGRVVSSVAEASGPSRTSAVPGAPRAFTPCSSPTLFSPGLQPAFWARTPAGTHSLPRLGDRAAGRRSPRPCPAERSLAEQLMTGPRCR